MKLLSKIEHKLSEERDINETVLDSVNEWIKEDYHMVKHYVLWVMLVVVKRVREITKK